MESDDDYQYFSHPEESSSPTQKRKLKRLKKAIRVSNGQIDLPSEPSASMGVFDSFKDADHESTNALDTEKPVEPVESELGSVGFVDGRDSGIELDGLLADEDRLEARRTLEMEEEAHLDSSDAATEEFNAKSDDLNNNVVEEIGELNTEETTNKLLNSKGGEEEKEKKNKNKNKKQKRKNVDDDGKSEAPGCTKRRLEKERKAQLKQLHAESQRLLRETRDVAFKPVPLVQKPISSILERIRQRKLEVSKKAGILNSDAEINDSSRDIMLDTYSEHVRGDEKGEVKHAVQDRDTCHVNLKSSHLDAAYVDSCSDPASLSDQHNMLPKITTEEMSQTAFRTPINDTQDLLCGTQVSDGEDVQPGCQSNGPQEVLAPSLLTMNLMLDSAPPDDVFSNEEDDDKENIESNPLKLVEEVSYPKGDPVKAFVDDEAEEEDDSDNDLMRFRENEDDEENEDTEEFNDLIVTGYKEKPIDNERRDQLHQKWLEQQDAAATDNVLQKLKCGWKQREPTMIEEDEDEESGEDSMDEVEDGLLPPNIVRINSKKVKQMIPQMFTDKDDNFLSSDDEETEQKLVRQRLLEKAEEHAAFLSPAEDESSREVFGLIKKLNVAPNTKKKEKSSLLDMLITGGNSNSSSKSSFLGRAPTNYLPSSHKQGSSNFRSFIFGRDDSNSRSGISASEVSLDMCEKENRPRSASAKFCSSQSKCNSQATVTTEIRSSSSLLEILRSSSMQSDNCTRNNMVSQTQAVVQFAALKSGKKSIKIEART